jgi:hypothetical protein
MATRRLLHRLHASSLLPEAGQVSCLLCYRAWWRSAAMLFKKTVSVWGAERVRSITTHKLLILALWLTGFGLSATAGDVLFIAPGCDNLAT